MRRILAIMLLAAFSVAALCQEPNKQLQELEKYLKQQGFTPEHKQSTVWGEGLTHQWSLSHTVYTMKVHRDTSKSEEENQRLAHHIDSISTLRRQGMVKGIDSIRLAFARLGAEASESHLYENHRFGIDTIKYSLINQEFEEAPSSSTDTIPLRQKRLEMAHFDYHNYFNQDGGEEAWGLYTHLLSVRNSVKWEDMQPLDIAAFEALVLPELKPMMKLKGAKTYPVHWQHDEGFDDEVSENGGLQQKTTQWGDSHTGLTTGTHYFIPLKYETEANALYQRLDSLAYGYISAHPEQAYVYEFTPPYFPINLCDMVKGVEHKGSDEYYLSFLRTQEGFHILSLRNKGERWVPREWWKLKSYINGEKVYLKGMEPKKNPD